MYKLFVYNWFTGEKIDWLVRAYNITYTIKLDDVGSLEFNMDLKDDQTNGENLRKYNIVRLYRYFEEAKEWRAVFAGFIQNSMIQDKSIKIMCPSMIAFFSKRSTQIELNVEGENVGDAVHSLLLYTNGQGFTPVTVGINESTDDLPNLEFKRDTISSAWFDMIEKTDFDIWIDPETLELNVGVMGADKSENVAFNYQYSLPETTNVERYSITEDGDRLISRIIGVSGDLEVVETTPLDGYPLLEEVQAFSEAKDLTSLQIASLRHLEQYNQMLIVPEVTPAREREIFDNYWVGDLVRIRLEEEGLTVNKVQRIVAITVRIGNNDNENITVETSDGVEGRKDILDIMADHSRRLKVLENNQP